MASNRKGGKITVADGAPLGVDFSMRDAARAADREKDTSLEERQEDMTRMQSVVEAARQLLPTSDDQVVLGIIRGQVAEVVDKRPGKRLTRDAAALLAEIDAKLAGVAEPVSAATPHAHIETPESAPERSHEEEMADTDRRSEEEIADSISRFKRDVEMFAPRMTAFLDWAEGRIASGKAEDADLFEFEEARKHMRRVFGGVRPDMLARRDEYAPQHEQLRALERRFTDVRRKFETRGTPEEARGRLDALDGVIRSKLSTLVRDAEVWKTEPGATADETELARRKQLIVNYIREEAGSRAPLEERVANHAAFAPQINEIKPLIWSSDRIAKQLYATELAVERQKRAREQAELDADPERKLEKLDEQLLAGLKELRDDNALWHAKKGGKLPNRQARETLIVDFVTEGEEGHDARGRLGAKLSKRHKGDVFRKLAELKKTYREAEGLRTKISAAAAEAQPPVAEPAVNILSEAVEPAVPGPEIVQDIRYGTSHARQLVERYGVPTASDDTDEKERTVPALASYRDQVGERDAERASKRSVDEGELVHLTPEAERAAMKGHLPNWEDDSVSPAFATAMQEARARDAARAGKREERVEARSAEVSNLEKVSHLFAEVQLLLETGDFDASSKDTAEERLIEVLQLLNAEDARAIALAREGQIDKREKERLRGLVSEARRRRQGLLKKVRAALREVHGHPADTEFTPESILEIREQLGGVRADILLGHRLLGEDRLDVTRLHEVMGGAETKLSKILRAIEEAGEAGQNVDILDALAQANLRDLRRLQDHAKRAVAELTRAELEFEPEDLEPLESKAPEDKPEAVPGVTERTAGPEARESEPAREREPQREKKGSSSRPKAAAPTPTPAVETIDPSAHAPERTEEKLEPQGVFARARTTWNNAMGYIKNGWSRVYREEMLGELAPHEIDRTLEVSATERRLQAAAGVAGGLASALGAAFVPDVVRWATQSRAAKFDRDDLKQAIAEAIRTRQDLYRSERARPEAAQARYERMLARHRDRQAQLLAKIHNNRRLAPEQKAVLTTKLDAVLKNFEAGEATLRVNYEGDIEDGMNTALESAQRQAEAIIDTHMVSKISSGKLAREGVNSALAAGSLAALFTGAGTAFAGLHFARGPAYTFQGIVERYRKADQAFAMGRRETLPSTVAVVKEGFTEWWNKLTGSESRIRDRRQALNTLFRSAGLGGATVMAGGALAAEAVGAWDLDEALDRAVGSVKEYAGELYNKWFTDEVPVAPGAPEGIPKAPVTEIPNVDVPDFRGEIPAGSRVVGGTNREGITYVLGRVIKLNPEAYGFNGDSDLSADLFAKRLAVKIAEADGQMRRWLTDKAVDKLNLFPEFRDGEWHVAAVADGRKLSMAELAELGYTSTAPQASK